MPAQLEYLVERDSGEFGKIHFTPVGELVGGRASRVVLGETEELGSVVEKRFSRGRLSYLPADLLYFLAYQSTDFPYQKRYDAIRAAYYRRKVLKELTEFWFEDMGVSDALYTRSDEPIKSYVLGTEFIKGKGPRIPPRNNLIIEKFFYDIIHPKERKASPVGGMRELKQRQKMLESRLVEAGLAGTAWQTSSLVATSNFLKRDNNVWYLVDAESGYPAFTPRFLVRGFRNGNFPMFDDCDFGRLEDYIKSVEVEMRDKRGSEAYNQLHSNFELLRVHTEKWKEGELALFRHGGTLFSKRVLGNVREHAVDKWKREYRIDKETAERVREDNLAYLKFSIYDYSQRIRESGRAILISMGKAIKERYIEAKDWLRYPLRKSIEYIQEDINSWHDLGRLGEGEKSKLEEILYHPNISEHLKGFAVHMGINIVTGLVIPPTFALVTLAVATRHPEFLLPMAVSPLMRTGYTLWRFNKFEDKPYAALGVGIFPFVGPVAYPIEMYGKFEEISSFMLRSWLSKVGEHMPALGGRDTPLEHSLIKLSNYPLSLGHTFVGIAEGIGKRLKKSNKKH